MSRGNHEKRGSWYLLTGLILGIALGLAYTWMVNPVEYVDASPAALHQDFKEQYRALIAAAYLANGDLARARARLVLLGDADMAQALTLQAQQALASGRPEAESRALGLLAVALGQGAPLPVTPIPATNTAVPEAPPTLTPTPVLGNDPQTPTPPTPLSRTPVETLRTPQPTNTPLPTRTPTPTPGAAFVLEEINQVCSPDLAQSLIQVQAVDAAGNPVPGVQVAVTWAGGTDAFVTGLKAELGLGYADFTMTPGIVYELRLADGGEPVPGLTAPECEAENGDRYWGTWALRFRQP